MTVPVRWSTTLIVNLAVSRNPGCYKKVRSADEKEGLTVQIEVRFKLSSYAKLKRFCNVVEESSHIWT